MKQKWTVLVFGIIGPGLVDDTVIYLNSWGSHSTSLSITFLTSKTEVKRDTFLAYFRSCGEASHEIVCVKGFWGHITS